MTVLLQLLLAAQSTRKQVAQVLYLYSALGLVEGIFSFILRLIVFLVEGGFETHV